MSINISKLEMELTNLEENNDFYISESLGIRHAINELNPEQGEIISCDFFGNGNYVDCILLKWTNSTFHVRSECNQKLLIICNFKKKSENSFWRTPSRRLHYQFVRDEK